MSSCVSFTEFSSHSLGLCPSSPHAMHSRLKHCAAICPCLLQIKHFRAWPKNLPKFTRNRDMQRVSANNIPIIFGQMHCLTGYKYFCPKLPSLSENCPVKELPYVTLVVAYFIKQYEKVVIRSWLHASLQPECILVQHARTDLGYCLSDHQLENYKIKNYHRHRRFQDNSIFIGTFEVWKSFFNDKLDWFHVMGQKRSLLWTTDNLPPILFLSTLPQTVGRREHCFRAESLLQWVLLNTHAVTYAVTYAVTFAKSYVFSQSPTYKLEVTYYQ